MSDQGVLIRQIQAVLKFLFGKTINFGTATATFSASNTSAQVSVPHGLSSAPVGFWTNPKLPFNVAVVIQETAAPDATNFYVKAIRPDGVAITNTQAFYWLAIG